MKNYALTERLKLFSNII